MKNIKILLFSVLFVFFGTVQTSSGQIKIGVYTGLGVSSFGQIRGLSGTAETLPVGLQVYYSLENLKFVSFNFGIDFSYSVIPFTFEAKNDDGILIMARKQNQINIGALIKVKFIKEFLLSPYLRLGGGLYSGGHSVEYSDDILKVALQQQINLPTELDISSTFGFNFGGGLDLKFTQSGNLGMFCEFVYHLNSRELDQTPFNIFGVNNLQKEFFGFDNWAVLLGFQVGL